MDPNSQNFNEDAMEEDSNEELVMRPSHSPRSPIKKNGPHWFGFENAVAANTADGIDLESHEDLSLSAMPTALSPAHRVSSTSIQIPFLVFFKTDWLNRNLQKSRLLVFL